MEKEEIIPEEIKTPQEEVVKVVEKGKEDKKKPLKILLIVLLLFLLVTLLPSIVVWIIYRPGSIKYDSRYDSSQNSVKDKTSISSEQKTTEEDCKCAECAEKECPAVLTTDPGFAIYSVPELKLSIEVSDHTMVQDIGGQEVTSTWDTRLWKVDYKQHLYFDNYEKTLSSYLYPVIIPEGSGCGRGCVKETLVDIHVFGNKSNLTLEQARDRYLQKFQEETQGDGTISGEIKTKWNERTYEFKQETPGGSTDGNILVKNGKIYQITYFVSGTGDANRYSQRLIESIRFN